ncbi:MAG: IS1634 family transposase, partial [Deinococcus sp.]|nr:IS1634 family transposase [Deinococcus sp.]
TLPAAAFHGSEREGYRSAEVSSRSGGVPQRWVVVESEERAERGGAQVAQRITREAAHRRKTWRQVERRRFHGEKDARAAFPRCAQGLRSHQVAAAQITTETYRPRRGRPRQGEAPQYRYRVTGTLLRDEAAIARHTRRTGRFLLATNVGDAAALPPEVRLATYLGQPVVERGFHCLKDPRFFTARVFLKTPARVAALALVMGRCLLVYRLGERELRHGLAAQDAHLPDQQGQPTQRPTLRWIFQLFQAVHLVIVGAVRFVHGLTDERRYVLRFFSPECRRYYLLT